MENVREKKKVELMVQKNRKKTIEKKEKIEKRKKRD